VAASLAARPDVRVEVQGHTDNTGSRAVNMRLSKARADAVEKFLEANGVSPSQLTVKGYGPDKPIASNKTKDGRAQNRRVELDQIQ
jgi:OOP family OmpA-OmpF porin